MDRHRPTLPVRLALWFPPCVISYLLAHPFPSSSRSSHRASPCAALRGSLYISLSPPTFLHFDIPSMHNPPLRRALPFLIILIFPVLLPVHHRSQIHTSHSTFSSSSACNLAELPELK
ncbi:hypothetical protein B0H13DRAFT_2014513 [Mycena leptocephala]|nr:hypothetical protein B0H13DRAFT_2014513 [Mycena leptocephala]